MVDAHQQMVLDVQHDAWICDTIACLFDVPRASLDVCEWRRVVATLPAKFGGEFIIHLAIILGQ